MSIPNNITQEHIVKAFEKIAKEGYSGKRESDYTQVHYKDWVFPPKVIVSYANLFANGRELGVKEFHGGRDTIQYLLNKGFLVTDKVRSNFFTETNLWTLAAYGGKPYNASNETDKQVGAIFNEEIWQKTADWAKAVAQRLQLNYSHTPKRWLDLGDQQIPQIYKGYTWSMLRSPHQPKDHPVYFTVGLDAKDQAFIYKIHCEFSTKSKRSALDEEQQQLFNELADYYDFEWQRIPFDKLDEYNWEKLVAETCQWISAKYYDYHCLVQELLGNLPKKTARICWNDAGWQYPSGLSGKSQSDSFERDKGFAFEEWLFDLDKELDGYHYGRIEPFDRSAEKTGFYDLQLYSSYAGEKGGIVIARILCAQKISPDKSAEIHGEYVEKGWMQQMRKQLLDVPDTNLEAFDNWAPEEFFNIRFRAHQLKLYENHVLCTPSIPRYQLLNQELPADIPQQPSKASTDISTNSHIRKTTAREIEYDNLHNKVQKAFMEKLELEGFTVEGERINENRTRIDVVAKKEGKSHYYEVKSYANARTNIRLALGQLLEYSFYPGNKAPTSLGIVSQTKARKSDFTFLNELKKELGLNVEYIHQDPIKEQ